MSGVLQVRLDGLPSAERLTLQTASVIGSVFWDEALLALDARAAETLPSLVDRDLVLLRPDGALARFLKEMNVTSSQPVAKLSVSISTVPNETTVVVLDSRGKV